jgi:ABC-type nitrate/sulfonate/bicarbonate transport system substrate-binding protein
MNKKTIHPVSILIVIMALFMNACGAKDKVTMQFSWLHQIEYTGFYVAAEKGYYADENIDITLLQGGPTIDPMIEVTEGRVQFGLTRGASLVSADSAGKDVLAIGTVFRKDPLVIMSLTKNNITTPQDLAGKTVGIENGDLNNFREIQFVALMKKLNVDINTMTFVSRDFVNPLGELQAGKTEAITGLFATNDLVTAKMQGADVTAIYYSDYGVGFYANSIFATNPFLKKNPDLAKRFMRATLRGYQYALENPDEAVAATLKYDPKLDATVQAAQMTAQTPLIDTGDQPIGWMDADVWQSTMDILLEGGFIPSAVDIKSLYTNDFMK